MIIYPQHIALIHYLVEVCGYEETWIAYKDAGLVQYLPIIEKLDPCSTEK